ncbi:MAG: DEAD/DEAH box helicase [Bacteroidales bacterium]|nr:DEAD/DEAH box helicase [Bacteroidales bacterium]MDZ4205090.1 DEAD/DEAH box helicase [Bacteroidales bacterium]
MLTFQDLGLKPALLKAVETLGFKEPMPVQIAIIPFLLTQPRDVVGLAQTGTGKTAAFGLPLLQHIDINLHHTQALILCPTRELCMQITRDLQSYAAYIPNVKIVPVYGGASFDIQLKQLAEKPQIIVATPGRLNDMIRRKKVDFSQVSWVVLDEADEMLDMGFQEEVDTILEFTPEEKHTLLFSATMPVEVERILVKYMHDPVIKTVGQRNIGAANVKHIYYMVQAKDRYAALKRIADFNPRIYSIIFCRTRAETQEIADSLIRDGYNADALHGDLSQAQRDHVMKRFRDRSLQMMVATDVAARGLDVNDLTHVINYNLPDEADTYLHRSGRTGRADKTGICISIIHLKEKGKIKIFEKKVGHEFAKAKLPTGVQVCEKQLFHHIDRMENVELNHGEIDSFLPVIYRKLEWMDREEIIKRFVSLEFNRFLDYYRNARDLNVEESREHRGEVSRYQRMFLSIGRKDKTSPQQIIGLINEVTRSRDVRIGRIDIMHAFSFVDVDSNSVELLKRSFANDTLNPLQVRIELASDREMTPGRKKTDTFPEKDFSSPGYKKRESNHNADFPDKRRSRKGKPGKYKRK